MDMKYPNKSGKHLINLCRETSLRILNGRTIGDLFGKFTSYNYGGCATVDYVLAEERLLSKVSKFKVHEISALSNHCLLSYSIQSNYFISKMTTKLDSLPVKFIWTDNSKVSFQTNITNKESKNKLQNYLTKKFINTEEAVTDIQNIIISAAEKSLKLIKYSKKPKSIKQKHWYTQSLQDLRNTLKRYEKLVNKNPANNDYRKMFL